MSRRISSGNVRMWILPQLCRPNRSCYGRVLPSKNCSGSVMCIPPCSMVPRQKRKIANAEKTAAPSLAAQKLHSKDIKDQRLSAAAALIQISGHPLQTFTLENAALEKLIARARQALENNGISNELLDETAPDCYPLCQKGGLTLSTFEGTIWDQRPLCSHVDSG